MKVILKIALETLPIIWAFLLFTVWLNYPVVVPRPEPCRIAPKEIKKAMQKMGPYYQYKLISDRFYVNRGDGKWLRLTY